MSSLQGFKKAVERGSAPKNETVSPLMIYDMPSTSRRLLSQRQTLSRISNQGDNVVVTPQNVNLTTTWKIECGPGQVIDPRSLMLHGDFNVTQLGANDTYRLSSKPGLFGSIRRIQLTGSNGRIIHDIENIHVLIDILMRASCDDPYYNSAGQEFFALPFDRQLKINSWAAGANVEGVNFRDPNNYIFQNLHQIATVAVPAAGNTQANIDTAIAANLATARADVNNALDSLKHILATIQQARGTNADTYVLHRPEWIQFGKGASAFCLPLWLLLALMRQTKYVPLEGESLNLVITWEDPRIFMRDEVATAAGNNGYQFSNLRLAYDVVTLHDVVNLALKEQMSKSGIKFYCHDWYTLTASKTTEAKYTMPLQKACADAVAVYAVIRDNADINPITGQYLDSFKYVSGAPVLANASLGGSANPYTKPSCCTFSVEIGSRRIPDQPISSAPHLLTVLNKTMGRYGDVTANALNLNRFSDGNMIYSMPLETDPVSRSNMWFTGVTLQNNQQLQLVFGNMLTAGATSQSITAFLEYTKIITITTSGVVVDE